MRRIGILGLDSSHPEAFARVLDGTDSATVEAVWDSGAVRSTNYTESFSTRYDATLYEHPDELVDVVDAVMVLSVDWDTHLDLAEPFLESGIPTLIDKPVAGRLADIDRLRALADDTPLFGGSAVSYHPALDQLTTGGSGRTVFASGYNDPFFYGVHLTDTVRRLVGSDWVSVVPAPGVGCSVCVHFENDSSATLRLDGPDASASFGLLDISEQTRTVTINGDLDALDPMYESYLGAFLETVDGEREEDFLLDAAALLLGVQTALESNETVHHGDASLHETHVDGSAFLETYEPFTSNVEAASVGSSN
ncbi:Gfo/Idh/MocA family oxidoreductase [Haloarchaeobius sp. TZWSO28]|uniref:Gfo/Idh/MocA family oxidoreductase n=1 Tax=Haloarchaeobius sp. TZWSO28 TaxID=3446119 RepID=UPI003EBE1B47